MFNNIPGYVYIIFIVLMMIGYQRCFTRCIRVERLLLLPLVFTGLSLHSMIDLFPLRITDIALWGVGVSVGASLGAFQVSRQRRVRADHLKKLIVVPGDVSMLVLLLFIFAIEFFIYYSIEAELSFCHSFLFELLSILLMGVVTGMTIGRSASYFYRYKTAKSEILHG